MAGSKQIHLGLLVSTFFLLCWNPTPIRAEHSGSKKGPEHWGELQKEWKTCKDGKSQSPIDLRDGIATKVNSSLEHFKVSYKPAKAVLENEGPVIAIVWEGDAGSISINGTDYILRQCHWHSPSEHSINGKRYDLELHMVHRAKNNNVAVVGFLYKIGKPNPFLSEVTKEIASMTDVEKVVQLGVIDPRKMKTAQTGFQDPKKRKMRRASSKFYRYMGSLTTPPCTEGVIWTINKQVHSVSKSQVKLLQQVVFGYAMMNARPLQPLNGRDIKLHRSSFLIVPPVRHVQLTTSASIVASGGCILRNSLDYHQATKARTMEVLN